MGDFLAGQAPIDASFNPISAKKGRRSVMEVPHESRYLFAKTEKYPTNADTLGDLTL